jgi:dolichol-phosphate mannosyltransferase
MKKVSVIIPFLNEAENIPVLVQSLNEFVQTQSSFHLEVVFVNDGSTDDSTQVLKSQTQMLFESKLISLAKNVGSHAALRAGTLHATGDYVTFTYADLQDPLSLISSSFQLAEQGFEMVWASRKNSSTGSLFSSIYSKLMRKYVTASYPKTGFDVVFFGRKAAKELNRNIENNSSVFLQLLTMGFKQTQIEYVKNERSQGTSKWTLAKKIKLFVDSFVAFSFAPIRWVTLIGFILFVFGLSFTSYLVVRKVMYNDLAEGWPMLMSVIIMGFGITNISLGVIAEYLWRTLDAARNRPVFIIDEIEELNP